MIQGAVVVVVVFVLIGWSGLLDRDDGGLAAWVPGAEELPAETRVVPVFARDPGGGCGAYVTGRLKTPRIFYRSDEIEIQLPLGKLPSGDYTCEGFDAELVMVELREPLGGRALVGSDAEEVTTLPPGPRIGVAGMFADDAGDHRYWHLDSRLCVQVEAGPQVCPSDRGAAEGVFSVDATKSDGVVVLVGLAMREIDDVEIGIPGGGEWVVPGGNAGAGRWYFGWAVDDAADVIDRLEVFPRVDGAPIASAAVDVG